MYTRNEWREEKKQNIKIFLDIKQNKNSRRVNQQQPNKTILQYTDYY